MPKDKFQIDMCQGPILSKILLFAFPLLLTNLLQLLFHTTDLIVIGKFSTYEAMAAIGATGSMNGLYVNMFIGISVGVNVLVARYSGSKEPEKIHQAVHTAIMFSLVFGCILTVIALLTAKQFLIWMDTPAEILPKACRYIWILISALPFVLLYNFGSSIFRAVGDTRRPFLYLVIAGCVNVVLNLVFVKYLGWDVEGVGVATGISHIIAAFLILRALYKSNSDIQLRFRKLKIYKPILKEMLRIGIPASMQGCVFSISNMTIQGSINSFGPYAMAGMTSSGSLEGFVYVCANTFHYTAISFVSQNLGAQHFKRIARSVLYCYLCSAVVTVFMGYTIFFNGNFFLSLYDSDPKVVEWGILRMKYMFTTYFLLGFMEVGGGALRGLGYSFLSMVICLTGACFFRVFWVIAVFPHYRTMGNLLISYPISWGMVALVSAIAFLVIYRKIVRTKCFRHVDWSKNGPGVFRGFRFWGNVK